jgi:hypothetical protein
VESLVRACPCAWHRDVSALDDAEAAARERALADQPAGDVREVLAPSPAHVPAPGTLAGIDVLGVADHAAPGAAGQTLDANLLHPP